MNSPDKVRKRESLPVKESSILYRAQKAIQTVIDFDLN